MNAEQNSSMHYALLVPEAVLLAIVLVISSYYAYTGEAMPEWLNNIGSTLLAIVAIIVFLDPGRTIDHKIINILLLAIMFFDFGRASAQLFAEFGFMIRLAEFCGMVRADNDRRMFAKDVIVLAIIILAYIANFAISVAFLSNAITVTLLVIIAFVSLIGDDKFNSKIALVLVVLMTLMLKIFPEYSFPFLYYWGMYQVACLYIGATKKLCYLQSLLRFVS